MTGAYDIGPGVAHAVAEASKSLPEGTTVDLPSLVIDLPHNASPEDIKRAVQASLDREHQP